MANKPLAIAYDTPFARQARAKTGYGYTSDEDTNDPLERIAIATEAVANDHANGKLSVTWQRQVAAGQFLAEVFDCREVCCSRITVQTTDNDLYLWENDQASGEPHWVIRPDMGIVIIPGDGLPEKKFRVRCATPGDTKFTLKVTAFGG